MASVLAGKQPGTKISGADSASSAVEAVFSAEGKPRSFDGLTCSWVRTEGDDCDCNYCTMLGAATCAQARDIYHCGDCAFEFASRYGCGAETNRWYMSASKDVACPRYDGSYLFGPSGGAIERPVCERWSGLQKSCDTCVKGASCINGSASSGNKVCVYACATDSDCCPGYKCKSNPFYRVGGPPPVWSPDPRWCE